MHFIDLNIRSHSQTYLELYKQETTKNHERNFFHELFEHLNSQEQEIDCNLNQ